MANQDVYSTLSNRFTDVNFSLSSMGEQISLIRKEINSLPSDPHKKNLLSYIENLSGQYTVVMDGFKWMKDNQEEYTTPPDQRKEQNKRQAVVS